MRSSEPKLPTLQYPVLMPIRIWKGCSKPLARHSCFLLQFDHLLLHGDSHPHAGTRSLVDALLGFGAAMPISPQRRTLGDPAVRRTVRVDRR
jgi:hypothetical protein